MVIWFILLVLTHHAIPASADSPNDDENLPSSSSSNFHCSLAEPTLDNYPQFAQVGFFPHLQLDLTQPSSGQVMWLTNNNNLIEFDVLLTPGVHRKNEGLTVGGDDDVTRFGTYARTHEVRICFNLDDTGWENCKPYSNPGGMALPLDLEYGWHVLKARIEEEGGEGGGGGFMGCRWKGGEGSVSKFFVLNDDGGGGGDLEGGGEGHLAVNKACSTGCFSHPTSPPLCRSLQNRDDIRIVYPTPRTRVLLTGTAFHAKIFVKNPGNFSWSLSDNDNTTMPLGDGVFDIRESGYHDLKFDIRKPLFSARGEYKYVRAEALAKTKRDCYRSVANSLQQQQQVQSRRENDC